MEELKNRGFTKTAAVVLVSDRPFYKGRNNEGIYKFLEKNILFTVVFLSQQV